MAKKFKWTIRDSDPGGQGLLPYVNSGYGGYNNCILGNLYPSYGLPRSGYEVIPNCTGYVHGRWIEAFGYDHDIEGLSLANAVTYYDSWTGDKSLNTPKVGAILVYYTIGTSGGHPGHVAVVEEVIDNDTCVITESNWDGVRWAKFTVKREYGWRSGTGWNVKPIGFIYPNEEIDGNSKNKSRVLLLAKKRKLLRNVHRRII